MPALINYMLAKLTIGFLMGSITAVAIITGPLDGSLFSSSFMGMWLAIYGLGSAFALGYLATALVLDSED